MAAAEAGPRTVRAAVVLAAALLLAACSVFEGPPPPVKRIAPAPAPAPVMPQPEPTTPRQVRNAIYQWFMAAGYQDFQAVALVQHAREESGYRPCAAGPAGLRYTYQWGGLRLQRLHAFARTHGCPLLSAQLAFADNELRYTPQYACFWEAKTAPAALMALRRGFGRGSC